MDAYSIGNLPGSAAPEPATSDKAHVASVGQVRDHGIADTRILAEQVCLDKRAEVESADKAFRTLQAKLALRGIELHIIGDGAGDAAYAIQRRGLVRVLPALASVEAFLARIGGAV